MPPLLHWVAAEEACLPWLQMSLRYTLDEWIMGEGSQPSAKRSLMETGAIMATTLATALLFPTASEKIFSITGATGVLLVCYVVPVVIHLLLLGRRTEGSTEHAPLLDQEQQQQQSEGSVAGREQRQQWGLARWVSEVAAPCGVLILGVTCSLAALWVALAKVLRPV